METASGERSNCPIAHLLDIIGDRWTLLIIRDFGIAGKSSFTEISASAEHIPCATFASRLEVQLAKSLVTKTAVSGRPGRQYRYDVTEGGADFVRIFAAVLKWSVRLNPKSSIAEEVCVRLEHDLEGAAKLLRTPSEG